MKKWENLIIDQPVVTVICNGPSVLDFILEDWAVMRKETLVVAVNCVNPIRPHIRCWVDRPDTLYCTKWETEKTAGTLWAVKIENQPEWMLPKIDIDFNDIGFFRRNMSLLVLLQLLEKYHPDKIVMMIGVDCDDNDQLERTWSEDGKIVGADEINKIKMEAYIKNTRGEMAAYYDQSEWFRRQVVNVGPRTQIPKISRATFQGVIYGRR